MTTALLMLATLTIGPAAPEGPAADIPELKVLDRWAGRWDTESTVGAIGKPSPTATRGTATGQWVLGGRYLRQDWEVPSQGDVKALSGSTLMTYDPARKSYRSWSFLSNGTRLEAESTWDAATRTMTSKAQVVGEPITALLKASFSEDGKTETWSMTFRDGDGQVVGEDRGKNMRRAP